MKTNIKRPSVDDMRLALSRLTCTAELLRDDDDPIAVLDAVIDELVELRRMKERLRAFVSNEHREMTRR